MDKKENYPEPEAVSSAGILRKHPYGYDTGSVFFYSWVYNLYTELSGKLSLSVFFSEK